MTTMTTTRAKAWGGGAMRTKRADEAQQERRPVRVMLRGASRRPGGETIATPAPPLLPPPRMSGRRLRCQRPSTG